MDIIKFSPGSIIDGCFYRKQGCHAFQIGHDSVAEIISIECKDGTIPYQPIAIDNMAGKFKDFLRCTDIHPLVFSASHFVTKTRQIYHLHGTLTLHNQVVHFKGCRGLQSLQDIAADIGLCEADGYVYMTLMTGNLGHQVDVRFGCYIERYFQGNMKGCIRPRIRIIDLHPVVYLETRHWDTSVLPDIPENMRPVKTVCSVSNRGTVIIRCTWKKLLWTQDTEHHVLRFGQWLMDTINLCC
jgi:hypothetical protein